MSSALRSVAFLGNYPPRRCGIATFTRDIRDAVFSNHRHLRCDVLAVNDFDQNYDYPDSVRFQLDEREQQCYLNAAKFINVSGAEVVSIQHEFGIYGGSKGSYVLDFARNVEAPIVTTLHTILEKPTPHQKRVLKELISLSSRVVVMSDHSVKLLGSIYGTPGDKIDFIPHGIPDMPFVDTNFYKHNLGIEDKFVMLTFGLLSANKGVEHVIEALPAILEEFPNVCYIVLGATHPNVIRSEGEAYRNRLKNRVKELGLESSVLFEDRYVDIEELKNYIAASDMYITPYLNADQIISGTLSYAYGCGKAVISTPYLHASELLADGRGVIVPFADHKAISDAALGLLRNDASRHSMRRKAYLDGREMIWSVVAERYIESFTRARHDRSTPFACRDPYAEHSLMIGQNAPIRLDHLSRMTDSTGIIQHARFGFPYLTEGYCTDDNARALAFMVHLSSLSRITPLSQDNVDESEITDLISIYAAFVHAAFRHDTGQFHNFLSYDRKWLDKIGSDDSQGRSLYALGVCINQQEDRDLLQWANSLFEIAAPAILATTSPRAWAHALLGLDAYLIALPGDRHMRDIAYQLQNKLAARYDATETPEWPWFEASLTYDNAILSQALIVRGREDQRLLNIGLASLRWLADVQRSRSGNFCPIGSDGFYTRGGKKAIYDQQPIEAAGMVSACIAAFRASGDNDWLDRARLAFEWFYGRNEVGIPLYIHRNGGCHDGLHSDRTNRNQGAESTLAYLSARVEIEIMEKMYGNDTHRHKSSFHLKSQVPV